MSDVERLKAELKLAEACEKLEVAREAMHADRTPETIAAYQAESDKVVKVRQAFRRRYSVETKPGDAAPKVETVSASVKVQQTGPSASEDA